MRHHIYTTLFRGGFSLVRSIANHEIKTREDLDQKSSFYIMGLTLAKIKAGKTVFRVLERICEK